MNATNRWSRVLMVVLLMASSLLAADNKMRQRELDAFWAEVSRSVQAGDFEGYKATCHPEGVLVSGVKRTSQPLSEALARWKPGFEDTKAGKLQAQVEFRFSQRLGDSSTAHETGIFRYSTVNSQGERTEDYIHFEGLLVKKSGKWKVFMEYQKSQASLQEWKAPETQ